MYADKLGSIKEMLFDLTLPILSVFSGKIISIAILCKE